MTAVTITIPGKPHGKGRPRFDPRSKRTFTDKATQEREQAIRGTARFAMGARPPLGGPVQVFVTAVLPVAASWPKWRQAAAVRGEVLPTKVPDVDNIAKLVLDAINGVVITDDRQITTLVASKLYGANPRIVVSVRPVVQGGQPA